PLAVRIEAPKMAASSLVSLSRAFVRSPATVSVSAINSSQKAVSSASSSTTLILEMNSALAGVARGAIGRREGGSRSQKLLPQNLCVGRTWQNAIKPNNQDGEGFRAGLKLGGSVQGRHKLFSHLAI